MPQQNEQKPQAPAQQPTKPEVKPAQTGDKSAQQGSQAPADKTGMNNQSGNMSRQANTSSGAIKK